MRHEARDRFWLQKVDRILIPKSFIHIYPHALAVRSPLHFFDDIRIHSMAKLNLVVGSMLGPPNMSQIMWSACLNRRATRPRSTAPASLAGITAEPEAHRAGGHPTHGAGDVPDNLQPFAKDLAEQQPDLNSFKYASDRLGIAVMTPSARAADAGSAAGRVRCQPIGDRLETGVTQHGSPKMPPKCGSVTG